MEVIDQLNTGNNGKPLETVLAEGYEFKLGEYVGEGFRMFGADAGIYIAFTILYFLISTVAGSIPFIGPIASIFINPALIAGWYLYARNQKKGFTRSFGNFFDGFKIQWIQLVLQNFITGIFIAIAAMIVILPFFLSTVIELVSNFSDIENMQDPEQVQALLVGLITGKFILGILLAALLAAAIGVLYCLAPMFILFRGMGFWEAMEASRKVVTKNYIQFLLFMIVLMFIGIAGVLVCCVGLLVAIPVIYLAMYAAFEDIMGSGDQQIVA